MLTYMRSKCTHMYEWRHYAIFRVLRARITTSFESQPMSIHWRFQLRNSRFVNPSYPDGDGSLMVKNRQPHHSKDWVSIFILNGELVKRSQRNEKISRSYHVPCSWSFADSGRTKFEIIQINSSTISKVLWRNEVMQSVFFGVISP